MPSKRLLASGLTLLMTTGAASFAAASETVIGMASAQSGITLDSSRVSGSATLFDGSTIVSTGFSSLKMNNGTRMYLDAGAKIRIYANRASLESGMTEIQSGSGFEIDANTVRIRTSLPSAIARIKLDGEKGVLVTALNAPVDVLNRQGLLVARVAPGLPLSFLPQAGMSGSSFDSTGCVVQKSGAALIVSDGGQTYELRNADLRRA
ncbi:MAG TPA: hypothetical protein VFC21_00505, partial [Bryobacteraceae bacterium]|nr:hypothetical protein [Bryobacteraceae bacterium]